VCVVVYGNAELDELRRIARRDRTLKSDLARHGETRHAAILAALTAGCTRTEVAKALGVSRQALARFIERRQ
jgi:DNA-binding transcriptional regulator LsrR (DeoR family)